MTCRRTRRRSSSRAAGVAGAKGNGASSSPSISADGRYVSFNSQATNLSPDDTDTTGDVYVRDLQTNTTTLASRASGVSRSEGERRLVLRPRSQPVRRADAMSPTSRTRRTSTPRTPRASPTCTSATFRPARPSSRAEQTVPRARRPTSPRRRRRSPLTVVTAAFMTGSTNLSPDDTDTKGDLYVRDTQADLIYLESRGAPGYARPKGASPPAGLARGRVQAVQLAEPDARPCALIPVLQSAGPGFRLSDDRCAAAGKRERQQPRHLLRGPRQHHDGS